MTVSHPSGSTSNDTHTQAGEPSAARNPKRDLVLGLGGFVAFLLVSLGLMVTLGSARGGSSLCETLKSVFGQGNPVTLSLLHTNDTWGYLYPCG